MRSHWELPVISLEMILKRSQSFFPAGTRPKVTLQPQSHDCRTIKGNLYLIRLQKAPSQLLCSSSTTKNQTLQFTQRHRPNTVTHVCLYHTHDQNKCSTRNKNSHSGLLSAEEGDEELHGWRCQRKIVQYHWWPLDGEHSPINILREVKTSAFSPEPWMADNQIWVLALTLSLISVWGRRHKFFKT